MKTLSPEEVPEVREYLEAEEAFNAYCETKKTVVDTMRVLLEEMNTKRQAADKKVRALGVFCGPWQKHNTKVEIDLKTLYQRIGPEQFHAIGGETTTEVVYKLDKKRFEVAAAQKLIPQEVAQEVRSESISYSAPKDRSI